MLFTRMVAALALTITIAGPVLAQNSSPACGHTKALSAQAPSGGAASTTSMADSSSDSANGSGASSAAIGTGSTDKTGVNNPCVPGLSGRSTGALPDASPNTP